jgi:hypothetical protein
VKQNFKEARGLSHFRTSGALAPTLQLEVFLQIHA